MKNKIIGFSHPPASIGGPGSFQTRLETELKKQGWEVVYAEDEKIPDVILVVGGTRKIKWLKKCKKLGTRIVHRLDGKNWLHRIQKKPFKTKVLCEIQNLLITRIRNKYADHIIYQSHFVKDWWEKVSGIPNTPNSVIYNAVDLDEFSPAKSIKPQNLICVEGCIDYSPYALETLNFLSQNYKNTIFDKILVYGELQNESTKNDYPDIDFMGKVDRKDISQVYRNGVFLSLDINAACPNTVIEALACSIPVIGFDTGALNELVKAKSGEVVAYGSNPWKLEKPELQNLKTGLNKILDSFEEYSTDARKHAEAKYSLDRLIKEYIKLLN